MLGWTFALVCGLGLASSPLVPGEARADERCAEGTRLESGRCIPITRSKSTRCPRGTRRSGDQCEPIVVPEFASLTMDGSDFECWRGYRRDDDRCVAVDVPENADLDASGHGWKCRRGYRPDGDACERLSLPANASLDASGNDWTCWRGYRRDGDACLRVDVPRYANLDASGADWECWAGYRRTENGCERLDPAAYSAALAAQRRNASEEPAEPQPATTRIRAAGLCGDEYVVGELDAGAPASAGESRPVRGRLGGESGSSFEFEGELVSSDRLEGTDDAGRSCVLVPSPLPVESSPASP